MDPLEVEPIASQTVEACRREINDLMASQEGWEEIVNKNGIQAWMKPAQDGGMKIVKTQGEVPFPAEGIARYLIDPQNRQKWNEGIIRVEDVIRFSDEFMVLTHEFKVGWPISNRDFVYVAKLEREQNRTLVLFKSCGGILPELRGIVRGEMANGSFVLEPVGERTRITGIFSGNPNGNVPNMIKGIISKKQAGIITAISEALSKHFSA